MLSCHIKTNQVKNNHNYTLHVDHYNNMLPKTVADNYSNDSKDVSFITIFSWSINMTDAHPHIVDGPEARRIQI